MKTAITAFFLAISFPATAQTTIDVPAKSDEPKTVDAKKAAPKKAAPAKKPAAPKKATAPAKPSPPSAPAKPAAPKPTIYDGKDPKAPILRDKDGNVIPTDPNAYDVSSAVGKKK